MKLQPESKKELVHIACGTVLLTVAMFVIFAALHLVGWAAFDSRVLLGGICGAAISIGNFYVLCLTVQRAAAEEDAKRQKFRVQTSYNVRILAQAVWCIIAVTAPCFQFVAGIAPLLFPRFTIYYLQATGYYQKPRPKSEDVTVEDAEAQNAAPLSSASAEAASQNKGGENKL
jgi:hypothetical protein